MTKSIVLFLCVIVFSILGCKRDPLLIETSFLINNWELVSSHTYLNTYDNSTFEISNIDSGQLINFKVKEESNTNSSNGGFIFKSNYDFIYYSTQHMTGGTIVIDSVTTLVWDGVTQDKIMGTWSYSYSFKKNIITIALPSKNKSFEIIELTEKELVLKEI